MKERDFIPKQRLEGDGWKFVSCFGTGQIWHKERQHILWNPNTHEILMMYESGER